MSPSSEPLSQADLDLLADYSEGLLTGDDADRVAGLIASHEQWALTYRLFTSASDQLDEALDAYAAGTPPLPDEVSSRIEETLRREEQVRFGERASSDVARTNASASLDAARVNAPASLDAARRRRRGGNRSARPWVGLSAAAAVIVAIVLGFTALGLNTSNNSKSATSSSGARAESGVPAPTAIAGVTITTSGMNYTPSNLSTFEAHSPNAISGGLPAVPDTATKAAGPTFDLQRLHSPSELSACLTAVTAAHGGTVTAVDFARYNGQSALIITLTDPDLRVAAGPNCGLPNSGADELASAPVR